jgi:IPT/TIG domain
VSRFTTKNPLTLTCILRSTYSFLFRLVVAIAIILLAQLSHAGGPRSIAGTSYFEAAATGQPLIWPQGQVTYFTDQGDLSPILPNTAANSFVADAFSQWTPVPTAALAANSGGQLAEDVNGTNVTVNSDGTISMPADIQPSATGTPVGVVYDYDGTVTDALLGAGAGDTSQCFYNAAYGGDDNFGSLGIFQHALIVINGQCALESSQLVDVEYRLVRVIGKVVGLDWSQANLNVLTGNPPPTTADFAGFPVMHYTDPTSCVPITNCYANPFQPTMDDVAALSRLYPVTVQNLPNFPGKQIFSSSTGRIHGSVWFTDTAGNPTQPMQGVNVVARWIDPSTNQPSRRYVASSVSGFRFTGNTGNPVTGFDDALGNPLSEWGSTSPAMEGFFDLAGLQLPNGGSAQYQLSVEPIDLTWSVGVGPYAPFQTAPSGSFQPMLITLVAGQDVQQDILMQSSAQPVPAWAASETWTSPAAVPTGGAWEGSLSGYGDFAYFQLPVQNNRTLSVAVTALDEMGNVSESKVQPVIGMWAASDPQGTVSPAFTPSPFNTLHFGMTRLDAQFSTSTNFLIGIADLRGDGRPDYHYAAQVLYADSVSPQRIGVNGGAVILSGTGFSPGLTTSVGDTAATPLAVSAGQMILAAPPQQDGPQSITVTNSANGASSTMNNALMYGAAASDNIVLISGLNSSTPVGAQAGNPVIVRVLMSDGVTPVAGATIVWSATNSLQLSACNASSTCAVATDQSGRASTWLTPFTTGTANVTASLAPAVYNPAKSVTVSLNATESASDIGVLMPYFWVAQGASVSVPLTARVLSNGIPQNKANVNFHVVMGSGTLSATSALTNSNGYATVTLSLAQISSLVQISACVAPANAPCQTFYATPVAVSALNLQPVSGGGQVSSGQAFQPVVVRVTDSSSPPNPVLGATVTFLTTVMRGGATNGGGNNPGNADMPVILAVNQNTVSSDINGFASMVPSSGGFSGPLQVDVGVTAGTNASLNYLLQVVTPLIMGSGETLFPPIAWPVEIRVESERLF